MKVISAPADSAFLDVLIRRNTATGPSLFCELVLDITEDAARP